MAYNYQKLKGKIMEVYGKRSAFASEMGWSEHTCSKKLSGKVFWKQPEITLALHLLAIPETEVQIYFFTQNVQWN